MRTIDCKKISLIDYLGTLGFNPDHTRKSGNEIWYISPFRREKTPSFKVTVDQNTWYDFGLGSGGSIIDFVSHYYSLSIGEAFKHLKGQEIKTTPVRIEDIPKKDNSNPVELRSIKKLNNPALLSYLTERGIDIGIADQYIKEIYYRRNGKNLFTVGMENDSKGYEVRTKFFKGCILKKDITTIENGFSSVSIFEGFIDFLSLLTLQKIQALKSDIIILHSTMMIKKAISKIKRSQYNRVYAFFDNDGAGNIALSELRRLNFLDIKDMRFLYSGHNDLNDKLKSSMLNN